MKSALAAITAVLTTIGIALVATPAAAASATDPDLEGILVPAGAEVEKIVKDDFVIVVITSKVPEDEQFDLAAGDRQMITSGGAVTEVVGLAAACTQSNTVKPVEIVTSGTRRARAHFSFTNGSGCSNTSVTGQLWGTDPFWGYMTVAAEYTTSVSPGIQTNFYAYTTCKGDDSKYWSSKLAKGYNTINSTSTSTRNCNR